MAERLGLGESQYSRCCIIWTLRRTPWTALAVVMLLLLAVLLAVLLLTFRAGLTVLVATVLRRAVRSLLLVLLLSVGGS